MVTSKKSLWTGPDRRSQRRDLSKNKRGVPVLQIAKPGHCDCEDLPPEVQVRSIRKQYYCSS